MLTRAYTHSITYVYIYIYIHIHIQTYKHVVYAHIYIYIYTYIMCSNHANDKYYTHCRCCFFCLKAATIFEEELRTGAATLVVREMGSASRTMLRFFEKCMA